MFHSANGCSQSATRLTNIVEYCKLTGLPSVNKSVVCDSGDNNNSYNSPNTCRYVQYCEYIKKRL